MSSKWKAFFRLSRPIFLVGGVLAFALGALVARYEGHAIDSILYVTGQILVTTLQLAAQYLNEYWDVEVDALNKSRTFFTGGSGVLSEGSISRKTAARAASIFLTIAAVTATYLIVRYRIGPEVWAVMLFAFLGAIFYSSPPLKLESTGVGELIASIEVAGLLPIFSYLLVADRLGWLIVLVVLPLVMLHYAMLLAFDLPDMRSDEAGGKRTLLVRIGGNRGAMMHNALLVLGFGMAGAASVGGLPALAVISLTATAPLAAIQALAMTRAKNGESISYQRLTSGAASFFGLATAILAVSFWALA